MCKAWAWAANTHREKRLDSRCGPGAPADARPILIIHFQLIDLRSKSPGLSQSHIPSFRRDETVFARADTLKLSPRRFPEMIRRTGNHQTALTFRAQTRESSTLADSLVHCAEGAKAQPEAR